MRISGAQSSRKGHYERHSIPLRGIASSEAEPMRAIILGIIAGLTVILAVCIYLAICRPA